eukprot:527744_1
MRVSINQHCLFDTISCTRILSIRFFSMLLCVSFVLFVACDLIFLLVLIAVIRFPLGLLMAIYHMHVCDDTYSICSPFRILLSVYIPSDYDATVCDQFNAAVYL